MLREEDSRHRAVIEMLRATYERDDTLVRMTGAGRQLGRLIAWTGDYGELFVDIGVRRPMRRWFSAHEWQKCAELPAELHRERRVLIARTAEDRRKVS